MTSNGHNWIDSEPNFQKLSESENEEESDTPESDKNLKRRTTNAVNTTSGEPTSSGGMFVPSPILYNDNNV